MKKKKTIVVHTLCSVASAAVCLGILSLDVSAQPSGEQCPRKRECVNIVVDGNGCPQYTTYQGVKDKVPNLSKSNARRMWWYAVDTAGVAKQVEFQVYFDPFKKPEVSGVGRAESQRLAKDVPTGVNFKYTVTVKDCVPMDPMIRISR